jgi:hypothetical protein
LLTRLRDIDERRAVDITRLLTMSIADLVEDFFVSDAVQAAASAPPTSPRPGNRRVGGRLDGSAPTWACPHTASSVEHTGVLSALGGQT